MNEIVQPMRPVYALAAFAGLVLVVLTIIGMGFSDRAGVHDAVDEVALRVEALDRRLERLRNHGDDGSGKDESNFIAAPTRAVAASHVQQTIEALVTGSGGQMREVQVRDPETVLAPPSPETAPTPTGPLPVSIDFQFDTTHPGLRDILLGVEAAKPLLRMDRVAARPVSTIGDPVPETSISVELRITGFWREGAQ